MENQNCCRLCSRTEATITMMDIFDEYVEKQINSYLSLKVTKDDGLPTSICILCYGKLDNFHNFVINVRKVQDELASTVKKKETLFGVESENSDDEVTRHDQKREKRGSSLENHMETDTEVQYSYVKKVKGKQRKSFIDHAPKRKSCRKKVEAPSKNVCIQTGPTLSMDLDNLKKDLNLKHRNLQGLEILTLSPVPQSTLGNPVSEDTNTSKSCLAHINFGVKTKSGEILMSPNHGINSKQLIKLPPPRIAK